MVEKKAINYYRSFYDVSKDLSQKQFYDFNMAIYQVMFFEQHIDEIKFTDKTLNLLWKSVKHSVRASVDGYCTKKCTPYDTLFVPLTKGLTKPLTNKNNEPPYQQEQEQEQEQVQEQVQYVAGLNEKAFELWIAYKGKKYTKRAKTLSMNKLAKYDKATQQEMVETSIMNSWQGLFEPKTKNVSNDKSSTMKLLDKYYKEKGETIDAELN